MTIQQSELKLYRATGNSDTASANGGYAGYTEVVSGVNNNLLPDVSQAQRVAGITQFRKVFFKNMNNENPNLSLYNTRIYLENYTPADDLVVFHTADPAELQTALTGAEDLYGCAKLDVNVSAAATSMDVLLESPSYQFFRDGDLIRISDKATIDGAGNEEFVTINGAPSQAGSVVTITFTPAIANGYLASAARVANVLETDTTMASYEPPVATTVGNGDYDDATYPIEVYNLGTVEAQWTVTFTGATSFTATSTQTGSVGAGSTLSDFSPVNSNVSSPYFTLPLSGWTGSWQSGDTLTFSTSPAHVALWVKRVVPAGAAAYSGDKAILVIDGETG